MMGSQTRVQVCILLLGVFVFNSLVLADQTGNALPLEKENIDIWSVSGGVQRRLFDGQDDLVRLAIDVQGSKPETAGEALVKIDVLMRACLDEESRKAIDELAGYISQIEPHNLHSVITHLYYKAFDEYKAYSVAVRIVEAFAPYINDVAIDNRILKYYRKNDNIVQLNRELWTDDETIAWLDGRIDSVIKFNQDKMLKAWTTDGNPSNAIKSTPYLYGNNMSVFQGNQPIDFWRRLRLRTLVSMDRGEDEIVKLAGEVRQNPDNAKAILEYINAVSTVRGSKGKKLITEDVKWLADICRVDYATDLRFIGAELMQIEQPEVAESFFRSAIDKDIADIEIRGISVSCQMAVPEKTHRLYFEIGLLEELSKCLVAQNKNDEAQELMVKAADIREKNDLRMNPFLAGQVQSASGAREIEGRILEDEKKKENREDPEYWLDRASYYRGRKEADKQEHALRTGLALSKPEPTPFGKHSGTMRHSLLNDLLRFLKEQKRENEAMQLCLDEMKNVPVDSQSSETSARFLAYEIPEQIDPDEQIIWDWLAKRPVWNYPEERLLWRTLQEVPMDRRDEFITRAEKMAMAADAHPSRAMELGWIINRLDEHRRSIPILQFAVKTAQDMKEQRRNGGDESKGVGNSSDYKDIIESSSVTLFESYRNLGDWRNAEKAFELTGDRLASKEKYEWFGKLAIIAAKEKETDQAMRIFRRVINCNFRNESLIREMVEAGLGKEVESFFAEVQKKLPAARLPKE